MDLLFIFQCTFNSTLIYRVKGSQTRKRDIKTLKYGLIAQMVRAHA